MARPRRWLVLTVESPAPELNEAVAEVLVQLGGSAVQEEGLTLRTFLPPPEQESAGPAEADVAAGRLARRAAAALQARVGWEAPAVHWAWQADEDWLSRWRAGLAPRRVGKKLIVAPTWTLPVPDAQPDDIVIAIDPKMAFGTGEHASTRGVLRLLEGALQPGAAVLDVGTGSAILAIAADRLGAASVLAVESDPDAIENAHENLEHNGAIHVRIDCAVVDPEYLRESQQAPFDVIVANVLRSVLEPLLPAFRDALRAGGSLILGGILESEASAMRSASAAAGFRIAAEDVDEEWWSARLVR